jgi:mannose-6-phosphate isomerase-like protein (cupin superfamily)
MKRESVLALGGLRLRGDDLDSRHGSSVLAAILRLAGDALRGLRESPLASGRDGVAAVGRLRGTGRGIHFRDLVATLEREYPIQLHTPFEGSLLVSGAAWDSSTILGRGATGALAKLVWRSGAHDLPMHVHEHSDRFIIVEKGRGFFHVSDQSADEFDGSDVRSIPSRERDVFLFTRGVVHTFSTLDQPMTLLSCQLPYLPFDDPRQYRLPLHRWIACDNPEPHPPTVGCDPAWTVLAVSRNQPAVSLADILTGGL